MLIADFFLSGEFSLFYDFLGAKFGQNLVFQCELCWQNIACFTNKLMAALEHIRSTQVYRLFAGY